MGRPLIGSANGEEPSQGRQRGASVRRVRVGRRWTFFHLIDGCVDRSIECGFSTDSGDQTLNSIIDSSFTHPCTGTLRYLSEAMEEFDDDGELIGVSNIIFRAIEVGQLKFVKRRVLAIPAVLELTAALLFPPNDTADPRRPEPSGGDRALDHRAPGGT